MQKNMEDQSSLDVKVMIKGYALAFIAIMVWTGFILISGAGALASLSLPDMMIVPLLASMFAVPLFGEQITVGLIIALVCISVGTIVGNLLPIKRPLLKI
jgi:drug/metabolite transporter (DMT)-like permease